MTFQERLSSTGRRRAGRRASASREGAPGDLPPVLEQPLLGDGRNVIEMKAAAYGTGR
jgi:hypothetical protein